VKIWCSFHRWSLEEEIPESSLRVPFLKMSVEDYGQDFRDRCSVEAAVKDPFARLSVESAYRRSPQKIPARDLKVRSLFSSPGLCKRGLLARSLYKISKRGLLARTLSKLPIRGLLARSRYEISVEALYKSSLGKIYV